MSSTDLVYIGSNDDDENALDRPAPGSVFIGREIQVRDFTRLIEDWERQVKNLAEPPLVVTSPDPRNPIQGLLVLLYGRGGFGKTTLLYHFRGLAEGYDDFFQISQVLDWQRVAENRRGLLNPGPGTLVNANEYYELLVGKLAEILNRRPSEFTEYAKAKKEVEEARKKVSGELERLERDDQFKGVRNLAGDSLLWSVRTFVPGSNAVLTDKVADTVKSGVDAGLKFSAEQLHKRLHDKLGNTYTIFMEADFRLGRGIGRDLGRMAKSRPILLFFDTYEEADEADYLLRNVMGAAGAKVGWVIAGRDNLWGGRDQRGRSLATEYGYNDIVARRFALPLDFSTNGVGDFTLRDVLYFFDQLADRFPSLARLSEDEAESVLKVTAGVPLAIKTAAQLYAEHRDIKLVTTKHEGDVVQTMLERYMLHAQGNLAERYKLLGLAMARRPNQPALISAALQVDHHNYESELTRLHRRYSFVFTDQGEPALHQEVRDFFRRWLLAHRAEPAVKELAQRLQAAALQEMQTFEARHKGGTLKQRLEDNEWATAYLDLTEQEFWLDPATGVTYLMPWMLAAAIYWREGNEQAAEMGRFFLPSIVSKPYQERCNWHIEGLRFYHSRTPSPEELAALKQLEKHIEQHRPTFPAILPELQNNQAELHTALNWRLGEAHHQETPLKALEYYEAALIILPNEIDLKKAVAEAAFYIAYNLYTENKVAEGIPFSNKGLQLNPNDAIAYYNRGYAYDELKQYQQAIADYDEAIELDPNNAIAYCNRAYAYDNLKQYEAAIVDYNTAIQLDPSDAIAYHNRSLAYSNLKQYEQAIADCNKATQLDPNYAKAYDSRGYGYSNLKQYEHAIADYNRAIQLDPNYAKAYDNRGYAYRSLKQYGKAITDYNRAIELDPNYAWAYFNRGYTYLWLKDFGAAQNDFEQSHILDDSDPNDPWMGLWAEMCKARTPIDLLKRLENIVNINLQDCLAPICRSIIEAQNGCFKEALSELEKAIIIEPSVYDHYFWQGMILAYLGKNQLAVTAIEKALENNMPPVLMMPLKHYLEKDRPDFYQQYAKPIMIREGLADMI